MIVTVKEPYILHHAFYIVHCTPFPPLSTAISPFKASPLLVVAQWHRTSASRPRQPAFESCAAGQNVGQDFLFYRCTLLQLTQLYE